MRSVELVEADAPLVDEPAPRPSWLRRHAGWGAAAAAVVVAVVVTVQTSSAAHDRARVAALATVPGVLAPLDGTLEVAWQLDFAHSSAIWSGPADGVLVSGASQQGGFVLRGTDVTTGGQVWTTPVTPDPGPNAWAWCLPVGTGASAVAVCTAGNNSGLWEVTAPDRVLWVVQPRTGGVLTQRTLPMTAQIAALDGHLLVAEPADDDHWQVQAVDPVSGEPAWTYTSERVPGGAHVLDSPQLTPVQDGVLLVVPGHMWSIDGDGQLVASVADGDEAWWTGLRAGAAMGFTEQGDEGYRSTVVLADGTRFASTEGELAVFPDDGSDPDLFFTTDRADGGSLVARSAVDGSVVWRSRVAPTSAVLVAGTLYAGTADALVALDAGSGDQRWRRSVDHPVAQLSTDGRYLAATDGSSEVDAYAMHDGTRAWSVDLRDVLHTETLGSVGFFGATRFLLASLPDGAVVALR
ncbi:outer membrane protein assembly factor BamB [Cellulomonas sp. PhB150]|nr:outer membrane protein assembly factor BamB [Cellulomonas sp. PhB150]